MAQNPYMNAVQGLRTTQPLGRAIPGSSLLDESEMTQAPLNAGSARAPVDPSVLNMIRDKRLQSETEDRLFNAQRLGEKNESAALQGLIGRTQGDIEANPLTAQKAQVDQYMGQRQKAIEQGFGASTDPVRAMNEKLREMQVYKEAGPERVAGINTKGDIERQGLVNTGAQQLEKLRQEGEANNPLLKMFQGGNGAGAPGGARSISIPGLGSMSMNPEAKATPKLAEDVTLARRAYENAKSKQHFWNSGEPGPEKATLDSAISSYLANHPASPEIKQFAQVVARRPDTAKMDFNQILQATGEDQLSPEEKAHFYDVLKVIRGF